MVLNLVLLTHLKREREREGGGGLDLSNLATNRNSVNIWDIVSVVNASLCIITVVSDFHQFVLLSVSNLILRSP